jgi:hypothetical protein
MSLVGAPAGYGPLLQSLPVVVSAGGHDRPVGLVALQHRQSRVRRQLMPLMRERRMMDCPEIKYACHPFSARNRYRITEVNNINDAAFYLLLLSLNLLASLSGSVYSSA